MTARSCCILRRTEMPLTAVRACGAENSNRLKRKDLRSACVSKSQVFVCYSVPIEYAVIVARAIIPIWTCVERITGVPIDYGLMIQHRSALCKRHDKVLSLKRSAERPYLNEISLWVSNIASTLSPRFRGRL